MLRQSPEMCGEDEQPVNYDDYIKSLFATKSVELPEDAPRLDKLEQEVSQLRAQCAELKDSVAYTEKWITDWFRTHLSRLAGEVAKEFAQKRDVECVLTALEQAEVNKRIEQAVEATLEREGKELGRSIFNAVCNSIQPYALKQR